jgi:hypothetical protein
MRSQVRDEAVQVRVPGIGNCPVLHSCSTPVREVTALSLGFCRGRDRGTTEIDMRSIAYIARS